MGGMIMDNEKTSFLSDVRLMSKEYNAVLKSEGGWWVGWVEEIPGVNCQERTKEALLASLKDVLEEAIEFNREAARAAAGDSFLEETLVL